jgi:hypothetical protein
MPVHLGENEPLRTLSLALLILLLFATRALAGIEGVPALDRALKVFGTTTTLSHSGHARVPHAPKH